ncbi:MAG: hypothetical protein IID39_00375 [Planctomycetes bacterium]|nr:hypothetical protein [Planctomycetota bacterium]
MESLRRLLAKINTQMADLTPSQRMAIALCAVVVVGSFMWLARWSAEPEWVRLLEEPMTTEQLAAARQALPAGKFRIAGQYILVLPRDRNELFWTMQGADALPADTSTTFAKLIADDSPFRPESENSFRRNVALQNELAKVIASSSLIRSAEVFIARLSKRRIGSRSTVPTASVTVTMGVGKTLDEKMVEACAAIVAGAVPGLTPHKVTVIDGTTMKPYKVPSPEDAFVTGLLREKQRHEKHLQAKVLEQLSYLPRVRVSVSVELDAAQSNTTSVSYTKPAVSEETTSTSDRSSGGVGGEPGVGPNVGQSLASGSSNETDNTEETTTKFQPPQIAEQINTRTPPFVPKRTTASVSIPRSYLVQVVAALKGGDPAPTQQDVDAQFDIERTRVVGIVKNIIMTRNDEDIAVDYYHDVGVEILPDGTAVTAAAVGTGGANTLELLGRYGPQIGLGLLAITGLVLMARMARKSTQMVGESMDKGSKRSTDNVDEKPLTIGGGPVGSAQPTVGDLLEGKEIDDVALRETQLREQVAQLVAERPAVASRLVRGWIEGVE